MNIFARFAKIITRRKNDEVQATRYTGDVIETKVIQCQGLRFGLADGTSVVAISVGEGDTKSYLTPFVLPDGQELDAGNVMMYARAADGSLAGQIELTNDGRLSIATSRDDYMQLQLDLLETLLGLTTHGSATNHVASADWIAKVEVLKQRLKNMSQTSN